MEEATITHSPTATVMIARAVCRRSIAFSRPKIRAVAFVDLFHLVHWFSAHPMFLLDRKVGFWLTNTVVLEQRHGPDSHADLCVNLQEMEPSRRNY